MLLEDTSILCKNCTCTKFRNEFTGDDFSLLSDNKVSIAYHQGDTIIKQGSFINQLYYIKKGVVEILYSEGKRNTILEIAEEGRYIGLTAILNQQTYSFSARAFTDCELCVVRKEAFKEIVERNEVANAYFMRKIYTEMDFLQKRIAVISTRNNHGKLATALLYLENTIESRDILTEISRKELAQVAAISVESLNKILSELKHDKIIELSSKGIKILQPELLKILSSVG